MNISTTFTSPVVVTASSCSISASTWSEHRSVYSLLCDQQEATAACLRARTAFRNTTESLHNKEVWQRDVFICQSSIPADMEALQYLNAFISERLTAAAVEIFGAVEKTLIEYQGEISRSKQEIDHLRTLVLWPEVRLHRSGVWMKCF